MKPSYLIPLHIYEELVKEAPSPIKEQLQAESILYTGEELKSVGQSNVLGDHLAVLQEIKDWSQVIPHQTYLVPSKLIQEVKALNTSRVNAILMVLVTYNIGLAGKFEELANVFNRDIVFRVMKEDGLIRPSKSSDSKRIL